MPDILCSFAWPRKPFITINNSREHESGSQSANQRPVSRSCDHSQPIRGKNCSAKANEKPRNHIGNRRSPTKGFLMKTETLLYPLFYPEVSASIYQCVCVIYTCYMFPFISVWDCDDVRPAPLYSCRS